MDNLKFYPYLTDDLMEKSGCMIEKFQFFTIRTIWKLR